jgi:predicted nucleic acid-binding protein
LIASALVDAGPLLAFLDSADVMHPVAVEAIRNLPLPLLTVESVLSELSFLLRRDGQDMVHAVRLVSEGLLVVVPMYPDEAARIHALMQRYASVPMSFADACLVRLSELFPRAPLLTFDRDFQIYRRNQQELLPLVRVSPGVHEEPARYDVTTAQNSPSTESP